MSRVRLEKIPPEIQRRYNIGEEVEADASSEVMGGSFTFKNQEGRQVHVDAVELSGTSIMVRDI